MTLVAAFVLALSTAAPVPPPDPLQQAKQSFQGTWRVVELTLDGKPEEKEELAKATCVVKSDRMEITFRGRDESVTFALDPKPNPPAIDLAEVVNGEPHRTAGIDKLEKDTLTICFGPDESPRPVEFKASKMASLMVLEKVKK